MKVGRLKRGSKLGRALPPPEIGRLELDVLVLLADEEITMTGMDFIRAGVSRGSAYTTLSRLVDKGFVRRLEPSKHYGLTRLGYRLVKLCESWWGMEKLPGKLELAFLPGRDGQDDG